jgi:multiple sugar transport system ATP-binding protein
MAKIELDNINKYYGGLHVVKDFNLSIADEEFVVFVGPSGCGKSTTLRMVAGLEEVSSGVISIGGRVVNNLAPRDRDIAMVFQNYALYQHMTVYDNLAFGLRNRRIAEDHIKKQINHAVEILGIGTLLQRKPKQLSGGQQQRVALGRCIVRDPAVFLFDEPLSNLDAKLRAQMRIELKELRTRVPTTSIYVTHDQVEAMTLGDRIVVMKDGIVQQIGAPLDVYRAPANRFVAGFLGSPAMNFVEIRLQRIVGGLAISGLGADIPLPDQMSQSLADHADSTVVLGVRPEHITIGDIAGVNNMSLDGNIMVAEQLGAQQVLEIKIGQQSMMVAGVDPDMHAGHNERARFSIMFDHIHLFETGDQGATIRSASRWSGPIRSGSGQRLAAVK